MLLNRSADAYKHLFTSSPLHPFIPFIPSSHHPFRVTEEKI
jgi:hypothetical protein